VLVLTTGLWFVARAGWFPSYLHHGTQRGVQSIRHIFIPRDMSIEHREIHWKPLSQETGIMFPEF
jgi:hypothetical protein